MTIIKHRATLGSIVGNDERKILCSVLDCNSRVNGEVVARNRLVTSQIPSRSVVEDALLHLEAVGVSVEGVVVIQVVGKEVCCDFLATTGCW